jgi:hypothetical protein
MKTVAFPSLFLVFDAKGGEEVLCLIFRIHLNVCLYELIAYVCLLIIIYLCIIIILI